MAENLDNKGPLRTLTQSGSPPPSRVKDAGSALEIVHSLWHGNEKRRAKWAQVDRMVDGSPPYNPDLLRNNAQSWRSNFNPMTGKAMASNAAVTFYDLSNSAETFYQVNLEIPNRPQRSKELSRAITLSMDKRLKAWPDYFFRKWALINDFVRHGRGFLFWSGDWRFQHVRHHRVMVPDATEIDTEKVDLVVVLQDVPPTFLWKKVRDRDTSERNGWNREAVVDAIRSSVPSDRLSANNQPEVQQALADNDMYVDTLARKVHLAHLYVKEFDGEWTHLIVPYFSQAMPQEKKNNFQFLFQRRRQHESLLNFCSPFFFEVSDGSWNAASGLGKDILPLIKNHDRIFNSMTDAVYLRTGINLQAQDPSSLRRLSSVQIGGAMNIWPPGFSAMEANVLGDLNGALAMDAQINQVLERNTGIYRPKIDQERGNPRTAEEMRFRIGQATVLANSAVDRWYVQEDRVGAEIWRRMKQDADLMREIRKETGSTKKEIDAIAEVTATRTIGNGSSQARQQAVFGLQGLAGSFNEQGFQNWLDDAIASMAGQAKVTRYNPRSPQRDLPTQQEWEAFNENADLAGGAPVLRYDTQDDMVHLRTHIQFMSQSAATLQQGGDPNRILAALEGVGPHAQEHLLALQTDQVRESRVSEMEEQLKQLANVTDQLKSVVKKQQDRQQTQSPQIPADQMVEIRKEAAKLQSEQQIQMARLQLERQKVQAEIENNRAKTQADVEARRAQAAAQRAEDLANLDR